MRALSRLTSLISVESCCCLISTRCPSASVMAASSETGSSWVAQRVRRDDPALPVLAVLEPHELLEEVGRAVDLVLGQDDVLLAGRDRRFRLNDVDGCGVPMRTRVRVWSRRSWASFSDCFLTARSSRW